MSFVYFWKNAAGYLGHYFKIAKTTHKDCFPVWEKNPVLK